MIGMRAFMRDTRGAAAAEMALILPMLLALMFGGFEAGAYFWAQQKVTKGVRDGARFAARQPFSSFTCSTMDTTARDQTINLTRTGQLTGGDPKVRGWVAADVTVTVSCQAAVASTYTAGGLYAVQPNGAPKVTVRATVSYPSLFQRLGFNTTDLKLYAKAEAAVMGS
jgi:Flp pilus assembly protein TadG